MVALSSPLSNVKLSVSLPPSCNAPPLINKATTQPKEVAFRQPITQYIVCCYCVSRPDLLNEEWLRELVQVDREMLGAMVKLDYEFSFSHPHTVSGVLRICLQL